MTATVTYDGHGRLTGYVRTGDATQANVYNGLDDRVVVTSGSTVRRFLYDAGGRVLGEYGTSATNVIAERIWMAPEVDEPGLLFGGDDGVGGQAPVALVVGTTLRWVHGSHLGVPLVYTSNTGATIATPTYTLPGFPGQLRTFADLYYNRYRDYDTSIGRYIQADPIGLSGGANPYAYALNNPVRYTDPYGLFVPFVIPVVAAVGESGAIGWGAATAVIGGLFLSADSGPDCPNRCKPLYDEINKRLNELKRRLNQFREDANSLPETRYPGYTGRTRQGEAQAFYDAQAGLRGAIKNALAANCKRIDPEAWQYATRALDRRYPRPLGKYRQ